MNVNLQRLFGLGELQTFYRRHNALALGIWGGAALICILVGSGLWNVNAAFFRMLIGSAALFSAMSVPRVLLRKDDDLLRRMAGHGGSVSNWSVLVNGVEVGVLADADYSAILHRALFDPKMAVRQVLTVGMALVNIVVAAIRLFPLLLVYCAALAYMFAPTEFDQILSALRTMHAHGVSLWDSEAVRSIVTIYLMALGPTMWVMRGGLGITNVYDAAVNNAIRAKVRCSALGNIRLNAMSHAQVAAMQQA